MGCGASQPVRPVGGASPASVPAPPSVPAPSLGIEPFEGEDVASQWGEVNDRESVDEWKLFVTSSNMDAKVKAISFKCEWHDQNWGNKKGRIQVFLMRGTRELFACDLFGVARANNNSGWQNVERIFNEDKELVQKVKKGDHFAFKYRVGGGGGHELHIRGFCCLVQYSSVEGVDVAIQTKQVNDRESVGEWRPFLTSSNMDAEVETISFTCEWHDQDWGNKKGRIQVFLMRGRQELFACDLFGVVRADGRTGWQKVDRKLCDVDELVQKVKRGDHLTFSYCVGGGGGHQLHIRGFRCVVQYSSESEDAAEQATVPQYWTNKMRSFDFDQMVYVSNASCVNFGRMLTSTYKPICTADRLCPKPPASACPRTPGGCPCFKEDGDPGLPTGYVLRRVIRVEDCKMWQRYVEKRDEIREHRMSDGPLRQFDPQILTEIVTDDTPNSFEPLDQSLKEIYLWHGTHVRAALSIAQDDFDINLAGDNAGTMYGSGAYMAESSTKADEYAKDEPGGYYAGVFALLLCRVCMGKFYYTTKREPDAGDKVKNRDFDSTCGDRSASANTFREFVVYNADQVYPEYIVLYSRVYKSDDEAAIREAANLPLQMELPVYWSNCHRNPHTDSFDTQVNMTLATQELIQRVASGTSRKNTPTVIAVHCVEDSKMWNGYVEMKRKLKARQSAAFEGCIQQLANLGKPVSDGKAGGEWKPFLKSSIINATVSSLSFCCDWKDQDWGNKKGRVQVALVRGSNQLTACDLFGICRASDETGWKHAKRELNAENLLVKMTQRGDHFVFSYSVGDGDGHEMHLKGFTCEAVYAAAPAAGPNSVVRCTPPNELDGNPDAGRTLIELLLRDSEAEDAISLENLDASINELLLWHGTSRDAALAISGDGFHIPRGERAKHGKRFGQGAYLAENLDKSLDYAELDAEGVFWFLLCRAACGEFYYTEEKHDVNAHESAQNLGKDSILANPLKTGPREFVVIEDTQVYPEFVVQIRIN